MLAKTAKAEDRVRSHYSRPQAPFVPINGKGHECAEMARMTDRKWQGRRNAALYECQLPAGGDRQLAAMSGRRSTLTSRLVQTGSFHSTDAGQ